MARRHREVIWTLQAQATLDAAIHYIAEDSLPAAQRILERALEAADSLSTLSERGRIVPELANPAIREVFVKRFRLIYEVHETKIEVLAFLHGARDFEKWQQSGKERG
ncbi:MAG: type II toxin-antitoxin system RelE/ParE family toxin [Acidobacteria bacterium]|nr:type II toxin-antitoxin system RelE/ParE family toxin [Acidobacteriota bacterium]